MKDECLVPFTDVQRLAFVLRAFAEMRGVKLTEYGHTRADLRRWGDQLRENHQIWLLSQIKIPTTMDSANNAPFVVKLIEQSAGSVTLITDTAGARVVVEWDEQEDSRFVREWIAHCREQARSLEPGASETPKARREGSRHTSTIGRIELLEQIKAEHPDWGQAKVAQEYNDRTGDALTERMVRNEYKVAGKRWPHRGRRTR